MFEFATFKLLSGRFIVLTSAHGGKFSDGTEIVLSREDKDRITAAFAGLTVNSSEAEVVAMVPRSPSCDFAGAELAPLQFTDRMAAGVLAHELAEYASAIGAVVWVSRMCRDALNNIRKGCYPNLRSFRPTAATSRCRNEDKVVDLDGWTL